MSDYTCEHGQPEMGRHCNLCRAEAAAKPSSTLTKIPLELWMQHTLFYAIRIAYPLISNPSVMAGVNAEVDKLVDWNRAGGVPGEELVRAVFARSAEIIRLAPRVTPPNPSGIDMPAPQNNLPPDVVAQMRRRAEAVRSLTESRAASPVGAMSVPAHVPPAPAKEDPF